MRLLSACASMFGRTLPMEQILDLLRRNGYAGVEILGEPGWFENPHNLSRQIADQGLEVTALTAASRLATGRDLANSDRTTRQRTVEHYLRTVELGVALKCPVVAVAPTAVGRFWNDDSPEAEWDYAVEGIRQICEAVRGSGVRIGIEVLNRYTGSLVRTAADARRMMEDVGFDDVGIVLDSFHALLEESSVAASVEEAGKDLLNFQISDSNRRGIGHGCLDLTPIMNALDRTGYAGPLSLEAVPSGRNPFAGIQDEDVPLLKSFVTEFPRWIHAESARVAPLMGVS